MSKKILVVYYSHSGNTRKLANILAGKCGGGLVEVVPEKAYPTEYRAVVDLAQKELKNGYHPAIKAQVNGIADYDTILVGTPNWCSTIVPPLQTFLESNDFTGKIILPFCTHGGGGAGYIEQTVKRLCPAAKVEHIFASYGSSFTKADVDKWLQQNGFQVK
ncbi:MAG: NAD(P)H-dependent oxidoreductase [Pelosinus sp.]|nr:NAD(P)H-dependent oxidoreductase [Pelosinus sp.]